ncbi:GAP family protein [Streptomyces sp. So13.3]|uniref:GAP family protein n=1 Tax=Streptomyces TaxID=1883 RepID=UPI001105D26C|nr:MULTISPECIES: GAP family protein [Streptomyces]MCZ4096947.1 GAP family protein [Streptomyces sp. H39-C1]QNA70786.1 GAP family protein [Streptomyces sp. So13.3]
MVLDLILIGLAITLYPLPIMAFVLVLSSPGGVWKGLAFILAWLACLVAVIAAVLLLTGGEPPAPRSPPSTAALAAKLAIGVSLVLYGERRRRSRRSATSQETARSASDEAAPASRAHQTSVWSAAGLAVLLQPWGMVAAAASTVVEADLTHGASSLVLLAFCVLATASLLTMELLMVFTPTRAQQTLTGLRSWLAAHQDPAIVAICLFLGVSLAGKAIFDLTR